MNIFFSKTKSFEKNLTIVGIPAKKINELGSKEYINNKLFIYKIKVSIFILVYFYKETVTHQNKNSPI